MRLMAPKKASFQAWLWLLQIVTGLGLCLFVFIHILDVSSILLGKAFYDKLAFTMEQGWLSGIVTIVIWLVGIGLLIHGLNGFRIASKPYRDPSVIYRHVRGVKHRGTWFWILQVISGSMIVAFVAIHYFLIHGADNGIISFDKSFARMNNSWFILLYIATLFVLLYHTINGLRSVLVKLGYATDISCENKTIRWLYGIGVAFFALGIVAIIRFLTLG